MTELASRYTCLRVFRREWQSVSCWAGSHRLLSKYRLVDQIQPQFFAPKLKIHVKVDQQIRQPFLLADENSNSEVSKRNREFSSRINGLTATLWWLDSLRNSSYHKQTLLGISKSREDWKLDGHHCDSCCIIVGGRFCPGCLHTSLTNRLKIPSRARISYHGPIYHLQGRLDKPTLGNRISDIQWPSYSEARFIFLVQSGRNFLMDFALLNCCPTVNGSCA